MVLDALFLPWLICTGIFIALIGLIMAFGKVKNPFEELSIPQEKWRAFSKGEFEDRELLQLLPKYRIQAIKFLRKKKNLGLKEAMDELEKLEKGI